MVKPRIGTDYLGRPVAAQGPKGRTTILLQDFTGGVGWLDPEGQHWYYHHDGQYACGVSQLCWRQDLDKCAGDNERGGHDHVGLVTPSVVRALRFNFVLRNFFALWGRMPSDEQFDIVARFYASRLLDESEPYWSMARRPDWVGRCVSSRFPFQSERKKAHPSIRVISGSYCVLPCVLELNSFCEYQRFRALEDYTSVIPLDYEQARCERVPDRTAPYVQRWEVTGESFLFLFLLWSISLLTPPLRHFFPSRSRQGAH